jgi:hypothetical protein
MPGARLPDPWLPGDDTTAVAGWRPAAVARGRASPAPGAHEGDFAHTNNADCRMEGIH